ncbi:MAG: chorismate-binding protein, partial [Caldilineaceae bacterium]|nr:chorismate-binding protein [Caldilineaceae bacterium]
MADLEQVSDYLLTEYRLEQQGRLVSEALAAPGITVAAFLRYAVGRSRFLWRDGRNGITFAGMGTAVDLMAWGETRFRGIERQARELFSNAVPLHTAEPLAAPRLFGGFAFREDFVPDFAWQGFIPAHFVLPHFQLVSHDGQQWLTINALAPIDEEPGELTEQLCEALKLCYQELLAFVEQTPDGPSDALAPATIGYPMPYPTWAEMITQAQAHFRTSPLQKVVLARVCEVRRPQPIDLDRALAFLQEHYPDCYTFLFEPQPHHAFFGATPELLVATEGRQLRTMGLAGSIQRGKTAEEDQTLADELWHSAKDRLEHALVVDALRRRLLPLTTTLTIPKEPEIYQLSNIQHLYTPVQGELQQPDGVLPLVEALHPTPALGGSP